jgi:hypothetical protein
MGMKDRFWYLLLLTVKRWTRAKLLPQVTSTISEIEIKDIVISVGGFGPVDRYLSGLFGKGLRFRFMLTLGLIFSIISPKPKLYFEPRLPDSAIGYIVIAKK